MSNAAVITKLPTNYAALAWGIPAITEAGSAIGAAVIKNIRVKQTLELIEIEQNSGFVGGFVEMRSSGVGAGGSADNDKDEITVTCIDGTLTGKSWPTLGGTVTITGTGIAAPFAGEWKVTALDTGAGRKELGERNFTLRRWADIDLVP
jgi:hypothetical protein